MDTFGMYKTQAEGVRYHGAFSRMCTTTKVILLSVAVEWFCPCNRFLYVSNSVVREQPTNFPHSLPLHIWGPMAPSPRIAQSLRPTQSSYFHGEISLHSFLIAEAIFYQVIDSLICAFQFPCAKDNRKRKRLRAKRKEVLSDLFWKIWGNVYLLGQLKVDAILRALL